MKRVFSSATVAAALVLVSSLCAFAEGKLASFEYSANGSGSSNHGNSSNDPASDFCGEILSQIFVHVFAYGGCSSLARLDSVEAEAVGLVPRTAGEPLIPFGRADIGFQAVESDVEALDIRLEAGYGPLAVQFDRLSYSEEAPPDNMEITEILGVYRMSYGSCLEFDLGLGALVLEGERTTTRLAASLPVLLYPFKHFGVEFRPTFATRLSDFDLSAFLTWQYVSLKCGYRWVDSSDESLDGPHIGLSFRY